MSTIDRATQVMKLVVAQEATRGRAASCQRLAEALAEAGLLSADLPEPDDPGIFVPDGKGWLPCGPDGPSVWTVPGGKVMVQRVEPGDLTPAQARDLAHSLRAAANHAEQEQP